MPEVDQFRVITTGVAPLAIHFSCKLVPHGVFCSLVAFLMRNCIKFQLPEDAPESLTLIDAFSHLEVYINAPYEICVQLCPSIWYTLFESTQKVAEILRYHQHANTEMCNHILHSQQMHLTTGNVNSDQIQCMASEHMVWHLVKSNKVVIACL